MTLTLLEDARDASVEARPGKLIVDVLAGVPGSGKSTRMLSDAAKEPGRYLFAVPTIDLLVEQALRFRQLAPAARCASIHSRNKKRGAVARQLGDLLDDESLGDHVAVFITHETLMDGDFSRFQGWHARMDEPPNAITCERINLSQSAGGFRQHFELEPFAAGWSRLRPLVETGSWKEFAEDSMWRGLGDFRKLAMRPQGVLLKLDEWSKLPKVEIDWFSLWTPLELKNFASITIAGAGFLTSIAHKVMNRTFGEQLEFRVSTIGRRNCADPHVRLFYFTKGHEGSTTYWGQSEGRRCLVAIERWLSANVPHLGFWSGNEAVRHSMEHRLPGKMVNPKLAGLNCHRSARSCAFIYSSKPLPQDKMLKSVFELTDADILGARENEDVFQFVMRGAIRNPDFGGTYDVYLYSLDQAERLKEQLVANGIPDVELIGVPEAGMMDVRRAGKRPKKADAITDEARERKKKEGAARRSREYRKRKKAALEAARQVAASESAPVSGEAILDEQ